MNGALRPLAFVAGCLLLFAAALGVGRAVGPVVEPASAGDAGGHGGMEMGESGSGGHGGHDAGGLTATQDGYALHLLTDGTAAAVDGTLRFHVLDEHGDPVTAYDVEHEKELHLVVVRRDLTGFQHVHPTRDASGTWSVPVALTPGAWRVLADTHPSDGEPVVLGADLLVPGDVEPEALGPDSRTAEVDGYAVTLGREAVGAGEDTVLTATVTRDGEPVTDLQPYLGAYGHLVSLRDGDVGYLHVHPDEDSGPGPAIAFHTEFPTAGRYRLFLDFRHDDVVRTAAFTVTVEGGGHEH